MPFTYGHYEVTRISVASTHISEGLASPSVQFGLESKADRVKDTLDSLMIHPLLQAPLLQAPLCT